MHLESRILVETSLENVWKFLEDPQNLAKWDHSVDHIEITSSSENLNELTFDTDGPASKEKDGFITSYKIGEIRKGEFIDIIVTKANLFSKGVWRMATEQINDKTKINCNVDFTLKKRYWIIYPILYLKRGAIFRDLSFLKNEIEKQTMPPKDLNLNFKA